MSREKYGRRGREAASVLSTKLAAGLDPMTLRP